MIKLWDISMSNSAITLQRIRTSNDQISYIQFNPKRDSILAAGNQNGQIDIWDLRQTHMPIHSFQAHLNPVNCLDWHPTDENILISGSQDRYIKVWNLGEANLS